jgi:pyruvate dehydrogenase (quinone)
MLSELTTAVAASAPVTWIVLNDSSNGLVDSGMAASGYRGYDVSIPPVDFVAWARSQGVPARTVCNDADLVEAIRWTLNQDGPTLLDVAIQRGRRAPLGARHAVISAMTSCNATHPF